MRTITAEWTERQLELRRRIEAGEAVAVNCKADTALVAWAKAAGLYQYVGRPTSWGNPFRLSLDGTRATVIAKYRKRLLGRPDLLALLPSLKGKALGCFCSPLACHAGVLAELANATASPGGPNNAQAIHGPAGD
jgi:hypothetical protein